MLQRSAKRDVKETVARGNAVMRSSRSWATGAATPSTPSHAPPGGGLKSWFEKRQLEQAPAAPSFFRKCPHGSSYALLLFLFFHRSKTMMIRFASAMVWLFLLLMASSSSSSSSLANNQDRHGRMLRRHAGPSAEAAVSSSSSSLAINQDRYGRMLRHGSASAQAGSSAGEKWGLAVGIGVFVGSLVLGFILKLVCQG